MEKNEFGKIYKLHCLDTGKFYIGSTKQKYLCQRLSSHVSKHKRYIKGIDSYCSSVEIMKGGNYCIECIQSNVELSKLRRIEGEYIKKNKHNPLLVNKNVSGRTFNEYLKDMKHKRGMPKICICGGKYSYCNKNLHLKTKKHIKFVNTHNFSINEDSL